MKKTKQFPITRHRSPLHSARHPVKSNQPRDLPRNTDYLNSLQKQLAADPLLTKYIKSREDEIHSEKRVDDVERDLGDKLERPYIKKYLKKLQAREVADKTRQDEDLNSREYQYPDFNQEFRGIQQEIRKLNKDEENDIEFTLNRQQTFRSCEFETFGYRDVLTSDSRNIDMLNRAELEQLEEPQQLQPPEQIEQSEPYYHLLKQTRENLKLKLQNIRSKSPMKTTEFAALDKYELEKKFEDRINEVMEKTWSSFNKKTETPQTDYIIFDEENPTVFTISSDEDNQPIFSTPKNSVIKPVPRSTPLTRKPSVKEMPQRSDSSSRLPTKVQQTVASISIISPPAPQRRKTPPKSGMRFLNPKPQTLNSSLAVSSPEEYIGHVVYTEGDRDFTPQLSSPSRPFTPTSSRPRSSHSNRTSNPPSQVIQQPFQMLQPVQTIPQPMYCMPYYQPMYPYMAPPPVNMYYNPYMPAYNYIPSMYSPPQNLNYHINTPENHIINSADSQRYRVESTGRASPLLENHGQKTPKKRSSREMSKSVHLDVKTSPELSDSFELLPHVDFNVSSISQHSKSPEIPDPEYASVHNKSENTGNRPKEPVRWNIDMQDVEIINREESKGKLKLHTPKTVENVEIEVRKPVLIEIGTTWEITEAYKRKHAEMMSRQAIKRTHKPKKTKSKAELLEIRREMLKPSKLQSKSLEHARSSDELINIEQRSGKAPSELMNRLSKGIKPKITKKEMYEITNKKYKQLPEVLKRQEEDAKREELQKRLDKKREYQKQLQSNRRHFKK